MARTGTGTRRPRAKTTGSGVKDGADGANDGTTIAGAPDQAETLDALADGRPGDDSPEAGAPVIGPDAPSPATDEAPSAGQAPEPPPASDTLSEPDKHTEPAPEVTPEPPIASVAAPAEPAPTDSRPPAPARRGGFALVLGGVLAAGVGAAAVLALFPQGWQPADTGALEARIGALESREVADTDLGPLESRIAALEEASPDLQPLEDRLGALEADETLAAFEQRIAQLEGNLTTRIDDAVDRALEGARERQTERAQALEAAEQDLATTSARLEARAALAELSAAAETGQPVPGALPVLANITDLPPALDAFAAGLPQMGMLQASFADAARNALAAAPLNNGGSTGDRVLNFLRSQTGARSLAPREGGDTDAILSRAEAHVRAADLRAAVSELDALPEAPAAAMAEWRAQAAARLDALDALAEVQSRLNNE